jgi:Phosphotransferase enzyme family
VERSHRPASYVGYGWLAAVLPAGARRIRTDDAALAELLAGAGYELSDESADVELIASGGAAADAPQVVVHLHRAFPERSSRPAQALARVRGAVGVAGQARRVAAGLRRRGYKRVRVLRWDLNQRLFLETAGARPSRVERFPLGALVLASREEATPTLLDEAVAAAGWRTGQAPAAPPRVGAEGLVCVGDQTVLRVSVGPAARQLRAQRAALDVLWSAEPDPVVAGRTPRILGSGELATGAWSVESRAHGVPAGPNLTPELLDDSVDFLVALQTIAPVRPEARPLTDAAATLAEAHGEAAGAIEALARRLDMRLQRLPRTFGHGDFWTGNLLVQGGRLSSVVDWAAAGPGRLPVLDVLHLHASERRWALRRPLGAVVVESLLPWAEAVGDAHTRAYCARVGVEPSRELLCEFVAAYWLVRVAHELEVYADRWRGDWIAANLVRPLEVLGGLT